MKVPVAPHLHKHLVLGTSWILAIQIGLQLYLILICISLITNDHELLSIFLFASCMSLVRWLLRPVAHILIRLCVLLSFKSFCYISDKMQKKKKKSSFCILDKIFFPDMFFKYFMSVCGLPFIFLTVFFCRVEYFILIKYILSIFFMDHAFDVVLRKLIKWFKVT